MNHTRRQFRARRGLTLLEMLIVLVILLALGTLLVPSISWVGERSQQVATLETLNRLREVLVNKYVPDMGELPRPRADVFGGTNPTRMNHPQLVYLFVNPDTYEDGIASTSDFFTPPNVLNGRRWQGPYTLHSGAEFYVTDTDTSLATGTNFTERYGVGDPVTRVGDPAVIDGWGNPIVIQEPDVDGNDAIDSQEALHARIVSAGRNGRLETPPDLAMPTDVERGDDLVLFLFRHDEYTDDYLELNE